jgi:hypothetical protein
MRVGRPNPKNAALNAASLTLGLGDQLQQQVQDQANLRKKKIKEADGMSLLTGMSAAADLMGAAQKVGSGDV